MLAPMRSVDVHGEIRQGNRRGFMRMEKWKNAEEAEFETVRN